MPPFDLDTAARHGTGPARLVALYLSEAVRDGAEWVRFGRDPGPGVLGAAVELAVAGAWYSAVPPPVAILPHLIRLLRVLVGVRGDRFTARLGGHEFVVRAEIGPTPADDSATLAVPVMPAVSVCAAELLARNSDENGLISFDDAEFP